MGSKIYSSNPDRVKRKSPYFKHAFALAAVAIFMQLTPLYAQPFTPVSLSGYNAAVVAYGASSPAVTVVMPPGYSSGFDNAGYAFVAQNYTYSGVPTEYLPTNGFLTSLTVPGLTYQLASYSSNNTLWLPTATSTGTLTYTTPLAGNMLYVLASSGSGASPINITVNFIDGTSQAFTGLSVSDWYTPGSDVVDVTSIGRVSSSGGAAPQAPSGDPNFYLFQLALNAGNTTKLITSITVTRTGSGGYTGIFAVSMSIPAAFTASTSSLSLTGPACSGSAGQSFTINGLNVTAPGAFTINAPANFQVSIDSVTWASTVSYPYTTSNLIGARIYVRYFPPGSGSSSGNITFSGGGITSFPVVSVSGTASQLAPITGATVLCPGTAGALIQADPGGTWISGNTSIATINATTGVAYGIAAGTANITYMAPCGLSTSTVISVLPGPTPMAGANACVASTTTLTDAVSGGVWTSSNTLVASVNSSSGAVTGVAAGTLLISYTLTSTGCLATVPVTVNTPPASYSVVQTGGMSYCAGVPSPIQIGLSGSSPGINYQLFNGTAHVGSAITGNDSSLNFGYISAAGGYTVVGTASTGCATTMSGGGFVSITPGPTAFPVSGTIAICTGSTGDDIVLQNSTLGIAYRLYDSSALIDTLAGTGSALNFGLFSNAGVYTVTGYNPATGCSSNMSNTATITVNSAPAVYNVSGGGSYCNGAGGVPVSLSFAAAGFHYSLFLGETFVDSLPGANSPLDFTGVTMPGTYTVVADNPATGCKSAMTGSAIVSANAGPTVFPVTGGGNYCVGGTGVTIGLSGTQTTAFYQAYNAGVAEGVGPLTGTGAAMNLGTTFATPGTYVVVATSIANGCKDTMGTVTVDTNSLPAAYSVSGGGSYCSGTGGVPVMISNTDIGVNYQLYYGGSQVGSVVAGTNTGSASFGNVTAAGTYRVVAANAVTGCSSIMPGTPTVVINSMPNTYAVTGSGSYCSNSGGQSVGVSGSDLGVTYYLYNGGILAGAVSGNGSTVNFGLESGPATYTVTATNSATGCSSNMTGSAVVNVTVAPTAYNVTGGGDYCAGGGGVPIGLHQSAIGVSYQVNGAGGPVGTAVTGTGDSINFGNFTTPGTYTIVGTGSGCSANMSGSATVTVDAIPTEFTVSGGGTICAGSTGAIVTLSGSGIGTTYQLYDGVGAIGATVAGTGGALNFGPQALGGTYTVIATNGTGCHADMAGDPAIIIEAAPAAYHVTGGGSYCAGGGGEPVGLNGSSTSVRYQLMNTGVAAGSPVVGTGAALSFGTITANGQYSVVATNIATGCSVAMSDTVAVIMYSLPPVEVVTGGGSYCIGGNGVDVSLYSSALGNSYSLYRNGLPTGEPPILGLGSGITFGLQTLAGSYTVISTGSATGCTSAMSGSAAVSISSPAVFTVDGSGTYCAGAVTMPVTLSGSEAGVSYQLYNGPVTTGPAATGTGAALDLGIPATAGVYTVMATNPGTGCSVAMSGSAVVSVNALPGVYSISGGGHYCAGGSGVDVRLSSSANGISYQLLLGSTTVGAPIAGTGSAIDFGNVTGMGTYRVMATNITTTCRDTTSGVVVSVNPVPAVFADTVENYGNYCADGAGVHIGLVSSASGVNYTLYQYLSALSTVSGGGTAIDFGMYTSSGPYSIVAVNATTGCSDTMSGSPVVNIIALPVVHDVNGGGSYCSGSEGRDILLDGSNRGMYYKLYNSGTFTGDSVYGTGVVIDFGDQPAGSYTAIGVNSAAIMGDTVTCTIQMADTAVVSLSAPLMPTVTVQAYPSGAGVSQVDSVIATVVNGGPDPTYQWYLNGNPIPGATGYIYVSAQFFNGDSLSCLVTSSGPCGGLSSSNYAIIHLSLEGVQQVTASGTDIRLIPNPNNGVFTLKGSLGTNMDEQMSVEVTNMLGQPVYSGSALVHAGYVDQQIQLSGALANGMYMLTLRAGQQVNVIHFVIEQ